MPPGGQGTCPEGPRVGRARMAPRTGWPDPLSRDLPLSGVPALGPSRALDSAHVSPDKHLLDISCPAPVLSACLHRQRGAQGGGKCAGRACGKVATRTCTCAESQPLGPGGSAALRWPPSRPRSWGAGLEAGPGCPLGRGVWPCGPPSVWLHCSGACAFPQCPGLASGSMPELTPGALPAVSVYGTPPRSPCWPQPPPQASLRTPRRAAPPEGGFPGAHGPDSQ